MGQSAEFIQRTADLAAGKLSYLVAGEGPDVVCLHPAAGLQIRAVPKKLTERFRVWLPIVPGYEGTPTFPGVTTMPGVAGLIAEFMAAHIDGPCDVVGHSMGARLAAWLAVLHPALIDQLVLMAPSGFRPLDAPPLSFEPATFLKQLYSHPERRPAETRTPEILESNRAAMRHYGIASSRDEALIARVGEIACLTLILQGTDDVRVPAEAVQTVRRAVANAQLLYVYDAAHALEIDQPERVAGLVEDFLLRAEAFIVNPGTPSAHAIPAIGQSGAGTPEAGRTP
jgi:pimeloyl-ACP methyl ester carboxylesterase